MSGMSKRVRIGLLTGAGVLVVVLTLVISLVLRDAARTAQSDFQDAAAYYQQEQVWLQIAITTGQEMIDEASPTQINDPSTLDTLNSQVEQAMTVTFEDLTMPSGTSAIKSRTATLKTAGHVLAGQVDSLTSAMNDVNASYLMWATDSLQAELNNANDMLIAYQGRVSDDLLSDLLDAINNAQDALDAMTTGQSDTYYGIEAIGELVAAEQAILSSAPVQCDNGVDLPKGVDPMVCQGMPASAITGLGLDEYGNHVFQLPSGNIGCDSTSTDWIECEAATQTWKLPKALIDACKASTDPEFAYSCAEGVVIGISDGTTQVIPHTDVMLWMSDKMENQKIAVLQYGQVANVGQIACLSATDGITCWDITTNHGFKMSKTKLLYW